MSFLCIEFVNSRWYLARGQFADRLKTKEWLTELAERWNIEPLPALSDGETEKLLEMRSCYEALLKKISEGPLSPPDIDLINGHMSQICFYRQLRAGEGYRELCELPNDRDWKWFMAEAAASFAQLYVSDEISKLKVCQNPVCGRFFIDESKSGNRKWCDNTCASLIKVRRFRQRQKEKQD